MFRRILLPVIIGLLAYGFWISPDFNTLSAGVAIFLFGMLSLENGFRQFTGGSLERLLQISTDKTWKSISFGALSTTVMQSSSLVSIVTISFLSAGLLGLAAGVGIIFGANLGTTTGAWLVAGFGLKVKISAFAMPMLVFGVLLVLQKSRRLNGIGYLLAGLGFLFLGIHFIKEGFEAFGNTIDLKHYQLPGLSGILLFTLIGMIATVVMQSSHATMVLIITALATEKITYDSSLALAIGANIGTTITAILGALSANAAGKRLATAHLIFNLATALVTLLLLQQLIQAVDFISAWLTIADNDYTLKLAVFHTLFNLLGVIIMTPFLPYMVVRLETLFVEKQVIGFEPQYLNEASIDFPETAVESVRKEVNSLYDKAVDIILAGLGIDRNLAFSEQPLDSLRQQHKRLARYDIDLAYTQNIKGVYGAIISFISKASFSWEVEQSGELHWLRSACRDIAEAVKQAKHMQKNMLIFAISENTAIRDAYNDMRINLVKLVRDIHEILALQEKDMAILSLDGMLLSVEQNNNEVNRNIASLLIQKDISKEMATSLMNDSSYSYGISKNLLESARSMLSVDDPQTRQIQHEVALSEDEIVELGEEYDDHEEIGQ